MYLLYLFPFLLCFIFSSFNGSFPFFGFFFWRVGGFSCQYTGGWAVLMEDIVIFMLEKEQYKGWLKEEAIQTIKEKTYLPSIPSAFLDWQAVKTLTCFNGIEFRTSIVSNKWSENVQQLKNEYGSSSWTRTIQLISNWYPAILYNYKFMHV